MTESDLVVERYYGNNTVIAEAAKKIWDRFDELVQLELLEHPTWTRPEAMIAIHQTENGTKKGALFDDPLIRKMSQDAMTMSRVDLATFAHCLSGYLNTYLEPHGLEIDMWLHNIHNLPHAEQLELELSLV